MICRTDNIGDVVLTLPITAWLKQQYPSIKISFLCRGYASGAVRACSTVDSVIESEAVDADLVGFFKRSGIDTIILAQPDQRLVIAAFKARIPHRIGNARQKLHQLLFCNRRVRFSKRTSQAHESQFNFEFLAPYGLKRIPDLASIASLYSFNVPDYPDAMQLLKPHGFNLIIHTKSNGHGREWPVAHYEALAGLLESYPDIHLWASGSATEGAWLAAHAGSLLALPNVTNICGKFTLDQFTAFIQSADGLIGSGTGPLHLSAALGQRTLGLFPPTRPMHPGRWAPVGPRAQWLCNDLSESCIGCENKTSISCECMENIAPKTVADIVLQWYEEVRAGAAPTPVQKLTRSPV